MKHEDSEETKERRPVSRWADNPIFIRLIRDDRRFSLRAAITLAALIGLVGLLANLFALRDVLGQENPPGLVAPLFALLGWFMLAVCPMAVAGTAGSVTTADVRSEAFQLVRLTGLSDRQMMWGYLLAAFHRRRLLLALSVTLAPSAILALMALMRVTSVYTTYLRQPPTPLDFIGPLVAVTALVIGLLLLNVIGGVLSVRLALRVGQQQLMAWVGDVMVIGFLSLAGIIFVLTVIGPYIGSLRFTENPSAWKGLAIIVGLCAALPLGLAAMLVWGTRGKTVS
jgi:hypothetical protein